MRVIALGAYRMTGIASKTGKPYDMARLVIRKPVECVQSAKMQRMGYGCESQELAMEIESLPKFAMDYGDGIELDLEVGSTIGPFGLESIITGCKKAK